MKAYFSYINSRKGPDGRRGVYGRQIVFNVLRRRLQPGEHRAADAEARRGGQGLRGRRLARHRAQRGDPAVPQRAEGAAAPERDRRVDLGHATAKQYPWTGGWQPDYEYEGRIYGQAIARNSPNAKIAVLYQNDSYGKDNLRGLKAGLGAKASNIVGDGGVRGRPRPTSVRRSQSSAATGATIFVIFATPRFTVQAYAIANALRWSPAVIYTNSVSATDTFLTLAKTSGGGDLLDRTYTVQYAKDPANPTWDNDAGDEALQAGHGEVLPERARRRTRLNYYGVAVAHAFVAAACTRPGRTRRARR